MTKEAYIWIYEYKDQDTPVGATLYEGFLIDYPHEEIQFPKLRGDWHWVQEITWKER